MLPRLTLLLFSLSLSCSGPDSPGVTCPAGTTVAGEAPPSGLEVSPPPETLEMAHRGWELRCHDAEEREQGPFLSWHSNGQLAADGRMTDGRVVSATWWDEHGRPLMTQEGKVRTLTLHHDNGVRAVEGRMVGGAKDGVWREWDEAGVLVTEVRFQEGELDEVRLGDPVLFQTDWQGLGVSPSPSVQLPESSSHQPVALAVNVVITADEVVVDGVPALHLRDGVAAPDDFRGMLLVKLYDRLVEKHAASMELHALSGVGDPDAMLLQVHRELPFRALQPVLYTAGQAGFETFLLVTTDPAVQWPPRSGLARLQGNRPLFALSVGLPKVVSPGESVEEDPAVVAVMAAADDPIQGLVATIDARRAAAEGAVEVVIVPR